MQLPWWLRFSKHWRWRIVVWVLFALELGVTIAALALFSIASPNTYRTRLWQDGSNNGFNSNPNQVLYAYANHVEPHVPLVWSSFITSFNVAISVLGTFIMLVKACMFILHVFYPIFGVIAHGALLGMYSYSVYAQTSSDMSDPAHPQKGAPWYITKSCSVTYYKSNVHYCVQAKASLAVTIILMVLFALNTLLAIYSLIPTQKELLARKSKLTEYDSDDEDDDDPKEWEMQRMQEQIASANAAANAAAVNVHANANANAGYGNGVAGKEAMSSQVPVTPRTQAFNSLSRYD